MNFVTMIKGLKQQVKFRLFLSSQDCLRGRKWMRRVVFLGNYFLSLFKLRLIEVRGVN